MSDKDAPPQPDPTIEETIVALLTDLNSHLQSIDTRLENLETGVEEVAQQVEEVGKAIEYLDAGYDDETE